MDGYRKFGAKGVNLVQNPYHSDPETADNIQNAELVLDKEKGGRGTLRKRGGLISHGTAFASGLFEMFEVRFLDSIPASSAEFTAVPVAELSRTEQAGVTISQTGGSTTWEVSSDVDDGTYIEFDGGTAGNEGRLELQLTNPITDPALYTFWFLNIRMRSSSPINSLVFRLRAGTTSIREVTQGADFTLTGSFADYAFELTEGEAETFALSGGLTDPRVRIEAIFGGVGESVDVSRIELERDAP